MKRLTAPWTTALATAALLALPATGGAQTPQTPPEPQPQSTTPSTGTTQDSSAAEHLRMAKEALAAVDVNNVPARAKSQIAEIKRHINSLERSADANSNTSATGTSRRGYGSRSARANASWANDVAAIDRLITELAGSGAAEPGTTGTTGTEPRTTPKSTTSAAATLDDTARTHLMEVRKHITEFAAAMSGTAAPSTAASAQQPSASSTTSSSPSTTAQPTTPGAAAQTPPSSTSPTSPAQTSPSSQPGSTTTTTGQPTPGTAGTPGQETATTPQSKVDPEAAKQHLTAARDTLTQITQLPAAAQLQGDARTQVSQLIQNFNELITTQTDWRDAYAKVDANLTALIGPAPQATTEAAANPPATTTPETTPANPPATPPANPPSTTQGTPGAVGTSGTTAATLDPAIKQKLMEFRQHLLAFHEAAGGKQ